MAEKMKARKTIYHKVSSSSSNKSHGFRADFRQVASLLKIGKIAAQRAIGVIYYIYGKRSFVSRASRWDKGYLE
jgi:hypothetical protein